MDKRVAVEGVIEEWRSEPCPGLEDCAWQGPLVDVRSEADFHVKKASREIMVWYGGHNVRWLMTHRARDDQ